jgi:hypothetical protein
MNNHLFGRDDKRNVSMIHPALFAVPGLSQGMNRAPIFPRLFIARSFFCGDRGCRISAVLTKPQNLSQQAEIPFFGG